MCRDRFVYVYTYCLRFANPAEAPGGLEAWVLEARGLRYSRKASILKGGVREGVGGRGIDP